MGCQFWSNQNVWTLLPQVLDEHVDCNTPAIHASIGPSNLGHRAVASWEEERLQCWVLAGIDI